MGSRNLHAWLHDLPRSGVILVVEADNLLVVDDPKLNSFAINPRLLSASITSKRFLSDYCFPRNAAISFIS